ncbi:MAG TPA: tetratricopeptide repeat protein [Bryobacteraceae bacterium]|jgi:tetratricopeptide (TPR) repeat protein
MRAAIALLTAGVLGQAASWNAEIQEARRLGVEGRTVQAGEVLRSVVEQARKMDLTAPNAAQDLNNLGVQYYAMARYKEAEALYRLSLKAWPASAARDSALTLANLGTVLRAGGRYREAEPVLLESLHRLESAGDTLHVGRALQSLAALYRASGNLEKAEAATLRAGRIFQTTPGADDSDRMAQSLLLAAVYVQERRYDEAEAIFRAVPDSADATAVFMSYNGLTTIALARDQFADAAVYAREALDRARRILPMGHPALATALNNMAQACRFQRQYLDAEKYYRDAITVWEEAVGEDHPDLARGLMNLAAFYHDRDRETGAEDLYLRAISILERSFGKDDLLALVARNELADVLRGERRFAESERLGRASLAALERVLGADDPRVQRAQAHRARLTAETKPLKKVRESLR